ncbi:MAG: hypothetical protein EOP86_18745 [Verrucomicrobiaceae bacterium]|nr:MAG: hypothetical protein EOP86_18745 [Verrucomicrobiaceae bacterium]
MKAHDIDHLLHLQQLAYGLLLWTGQRAENDPSVLSDLMLEKWRSASSTESWLREAYGTFPVRLRPSRNDFEALAKLFSAFFQTSFHVAVTSSRWHGHYESIPRRRLVPGLPAGGSKSTQAKKRIRESMRQLRLAALSRLASDTQHEISPPDLERLERRDGLQEPLALWTYFQELERRAHFVSQGLAVHGLWKAMEAEQRQDMDSARILAARDALLKALSAWSETAGN